MRLGEGLLGAPPLAGLGASEPPGTRLHALVSGLQAPAVTRQTFILATLEISLELWTKWKEESFCRKKKKKIETKDFLLLVNSIMFICLISWHVVIKIINRMK